MKLKCILAAGAIAFISTAAQAGIILQTTKVTFADNNHSYQAFLLDESDGITWEAAQAAAVALGGNLATITSAAENNFVFTFISSYKQDNANVITSAWLGGEKIEERVNGVLMTSWTWVTGEAWSYSNWGTEPGKTQLQYQGANRTWMTGHPWDTSFAYVVEWEPSAVVPETGTIFAGALLLLPLGLSSIRRLRRMR